MIKRFVFSLVLLSVLSCVCACKNPYFSKAYDSTDSFGSVFEGHRVPQDVR